MSNESIILVSCSVLVAVSIWKKPICELTLLLIMFLLLSFMGLYLVVAKNIDTTLSTKYWNVISVLLGAFVGRISHGIQKQKDDNKKQS